MADGVRSTQPSMVRFIVSTLLAGLSWGSAFFVFFGLAQPILTDPRLQSQKFLAVMFVIEPLPRVTEQPATLLAAFVVLGFIHAFLFYALLPALPKERFARGLAFGAVAWLFCFPWFEYYLPWNVMHEPALLVGFELLIWAVLTMLVGLALSISAPIAGDPTRRIQNRSKYPGR